MEIDRLGNNIHSDIQKGVSDGLNKNRGVACNTEDSLYDFVYKRLQNGVGFIVWDEIFDKINISFYLSTNYRV